MLCADGYTCPCQLEHGHEGNHEHHSNGIAMSWKRVGERRIYEEAPKSDKLSLCAGCDQGNDECECVVEPRIIHDEQHFPISLLGLVATPPKSFTFGLGS